MGRQLASFDGITYTYNEDGIRTSKTVNGERTYYYVDGTQLFEQTIGNDCGLHFFYDRNGELTAFARYYEDDEPIQDLYYYVKNAQGDITDITDDWGNIIASYTYDPWGKVLSVTGSDTVIGNLNPFRYRGYYYDDETGLYYLQSRYYDPEVGRFINADDVNFIGITGSEISYNPFAYCGNEPVNDSDKYGYAAKDITSKLMSLMRGNVGILATELSNNISKYGKIKGKAQTITYFIKCVKTGGVWDLKSKPEWKLKATDYFVFFGFKLRFDDPGNIHFGYVGSILFGEKFLRTGAGLYQILSGTSSWKYVKSYFDDPRDSAMISVGCNLFNLDIALSALNMIALVNRLRRIFK